MIVLVCSSAAFAAAFEVWGAFWLLSSCVLRVVLRPRLHLVLHLELFIWLQEGGLGAPEHDFRWGCVRRRNIKGARHTYISLVLGGAALEDLTLGHYRGFASASTAHLLVRHLKLWGSGSWLRLRLWVHHLVVMWRHFGWSYILQAGLTRLFLAHLIHMMVLLL